MTTAIITHTYQESAMTDQDIARIQHVIDHIEASYPCSLQGVVNWCTEQGFEDYCGPVVTSMLADHHVELYVQDGAMVISPL